MPFFSTKVKARNFLSNIAYRRIKSKDSNHISFITDVYPFLVEDFNPLFLDSRFTIEKDREMVNMFWQQCIPKTLLEFISICQNFELLCKSNNSYKDAKIIIKNFAGSQINLNSLHTYFKKYFTTYQYIYLRLLLRYYTITINLVLKTKLSLLCITRTEKVVSRLF